MSRTGEVGERTVDLAQWQIAQQEERVARQRALVKALERDGHQKVAREARQFLQQMLDALLQMKESPR